MASCPRAKSHKSYPDSEYESQIKVYSKNNIVRKGLRLFIQIDIDLYRLQQLVSNQISAQKCLPVECISTD